MKKTILLLMASCAILAGCGNHSHEGHEHDHGTAEACEGHDHEGHNHGAEEHAGHGHAEEAEHGHEGHNHNGKIEVSLERQKTFGITTDTVSVGDFAEVIHTSGQILSAMGDEMTVVAKTSGVISFGKLTEGSAVGKGSIIATISSKDLGGGDQLAKAKAVYEAAKKEYERDIQLSKDNIVSESHLDQSKLAFEQAKAEYDALASSTSKDGGVSVASPLGGFIKKLPVGQGDYVETGTPIAVVSQNRRLRLRADVSERYYGLLSGLKDANFTTSYSDNVYNLKELGGRLLGYGKASDGDCYIPVTFEFDNKGDLIAGSYVDIFLKSSNTSKAISVPISAVVEDQGIHYVFVQHDATGFFKREVKLGQSDGERVLVKSGLKEGEVVVATGAVQVKLASVTAVPAGHSHSH
ncbi:MAG TPA: efflux transporter periplasmic adaptor subunit [Rikenellaceae bacterium]|nr:efflux transporter periplasmic adaptor subunit [Rikenellaceae bacterium]